MRVVATRRRATGRRGARRTSCEQRLLGLEARSSTGRARRARGGRSSCVGSSSGRFSRCSCMRCTKYGTQPMPDSRNADPQRREPVEHAAHGQRGERHHLVDRERQAVAPGRSWRTARPPGRGRFMPGARVHGDARRRASAAASKNGSSDGSSRLRSPSTGGIVTATAPSATARSQLGDRAVDVLQRHDGDALEPVGRVAAHLVEQPVVVGPGEVEGEAGVVVASVTPIDSPPKSTWTSMPSASMSAQPLVEVGRAGRARGVHGRVDRHAAARALLGRVELAARSPRPTGRRTARPTATRVQRVELGPAQRVLVHVGVGVDRTSHPARRIRLSARATGIVRITIDRERCMGSGNCAFHAPATFDLDDDMKAIVIDADGDPATRCGAVDGCPTLALVDEARHDARDQRRPRRAARRRRGGGSTTTADPAVARGRARRRRRDAAAVLGRPRRAGLARACTCPRTYGGEGYGLAELAVVLEELGRACAPGPFLPTVLAVGRRSIASAATTQRATLAPGLADGSTPGAVGARRGRRRVVGAPAAHRLRVASTGARRRSAGRCCVPDAGRRAGTSSRCRRGRRHDREPRRDPARRRGRRRRPWRRRDRLLDVGDDGRRRRASPSSLLSPPSASGGAAWCVETAAAYATGARAVRSPDRPVPGGEAPVRRHAAAPSSRPAPRRGTRPGGGAGRRGRARRPSVAGALAPEAFFAGAEGLHPGARRHRLHVGARRPPLPQAGHGTAAARSAARRAWRARGRRRWPHARRAPRRSPSTCPPKPSRSPAEVRASSTSCATHDKAEWNAAHRRRRLPRAALARAVGPRRRRRRAARHRRGVRRSARPPAAPRRSARGCCRRSSPTARAEQQERWIAADAAGRDARGARLFSEPGAGSDLASLATKAEPRRRRLAAHRPEGVDDDGAPRRLGHLPRPHRPRRCRSTTASPASSST